MNIRMHVLVCALASVACGGAENQQAQDPTSSYNTSTRTETSTTTAASLADPVATAPNSSPSNVTTVRETAPASKGMTPNATTPNATTPSATTPPPVNSPAAIDQSKSADQGKNADNTKVNERDRRGSTLTPMDQGNSGAETKISATIRRGLMSDGSLSFAAKNVKVITIGTKVTLRGPVKNEHEKASIEALAKQTAGVSDVDNQLEVKK